MISIYTCIQMVKIYLNPKLQILLPVTVTLMLLLQDRQQALKFSLLLKLQLLEHIMLELNSIMQQLLITN